MYKVFRKLLTRFSCQFSGNIDIIIHHSKIMSDASLEPLAIHYGLVRVILNIPKNVNK